jgi:hypothetical protein
MYMEARGRKLSAHMKHKIYEARTLVLKGRVLATMVHAWHYQVAMCVGASRAQCTLQTAILILARTTSDDDASACRLATADEAPCLLS